MPNLNLLAFDTSTESLSIALGWHAGGQPHLLEHTGAGGQQASATLVPAILRLLAEAGMKMAALDAIVFGRGPGSFTGLRTACAVAQGLGFGAGVPVLGVDTLLAVAEDARHRHGAERVVALLDARMDEVYVARCVFESGAWRQDAPAMLASPQDVRVPDGWVMAGNAFAAYGARLPAGVHLETLPTAAALLRLAPALLAAGAGGPAAAALPLYIRDKVAQTTDERALLRAVEQAR